jgi:hypothetical protein
MAVATLNGGKRLVGRHQQATGFEIVFKGEHMKLSGEGHASGHAMQQVLVWGLKVSAGHCRMEEEDHHSQ